MSGVPDCIRCQKRMRMISKDTELCTFCWETERYLAQYLASGGVGARIFVSTALANQAIADRAKTFHLLADRPTEPAPIAAGDERIACKECFCHGMVNSECRCGRCNGTGLEPGL